MQIHLFVLHALPEALDEEIVAPGVLAVHAELDAVLPHYPDKGGAGELAALAGFFVAGSVRTACPITSSKRIGKQAGSWEYAGPSAGEENHPERRMGDRRRTSPGAKQPTLRSIISSRSPVALVHDAIHRLTAAAFSRLPEMESSSNTSTVGVGVTTMKIW